MHATRIDLSAKVRKEVVPLLQARLVDLLDLKLAIKQAHWNVKGANFMETHEFFDELAGRVEDLADGLAERITSLGGVALGSSQVVAKATTLKPYPADVFASLDHITALAERFAATTKETRVAIKESASAGDEVTADLFNETTGILDKDLWFLEAHLQAG